MELLRHGLQADYVMLGGGNTKQLKGLPPGVRLGTNAHAILGGIRLWSQPTTRLARRPRLARSRRKRKPSPTPIAGAEGNLPPSAS